MALKKLVGSAAKDSIKAIKALSMTSTNKPRLKASASSPPGENLVNARLHPKPPTRRLFSKSSNQSWSVRCSKTCPQSSHLNRSAPSFSKQATSATWTDWHVRDCSKLGRTPLSWTTQSSIVREAKKRYSCAMDRHSLMKAVSLSSKDSNSTSTILSFSLWWSQTKISWSRHRSTGTLLWGTPRRSNLDWKDVSRVKWTQWGLVDWTHRIHHALNSLKTLWSQLLETTIWWLVGCKTP